jgi:DNA-binding PadR family transcriptional regulator
MADKTLADEMEWLDGRFLKSIGRLHYLCLIERGHDTGYSLLQYSQAHYGIKLSAAAVYPVLQSLETEGYVVGRWVKEKRHDKKRYSLTAKGKKTLSALRDRITLLVAEITGAPEAGRTCI